MPPRQSTAAEYARRVILAERYIEEHLDDEVAPVDVAKACGFSLYHFHRIFRGVTGESVTENLRRLRLERAAKSLRLTERSVTQVAFEAGYGSHEAFTRAFAEHFGAPPSTYRGEPAARLRDFVPSPIRVEVRTIPPVAAVAMRHVGRAAEVHDLFQRLFAWGARRGVDFATASVYGLFPDDPDITPDGRIRADACLAGPGLTLDAEVTPLEIPGGIYAVAVHVGPYDTLSRTYLELVGGWLPTTSHEAAPEPVVEAYVDPPSVPEAERRTEVRVRLVG